MAKKWKAYAWPEREPAKDPEEEEEIIDVVGDSQGACWGPSSPTEGATAPSPPPGSPSGTTLLYNGESPIHQKLLLSTLQLTGGHWQGQLVDSTTSLLWPESGNIVFRPLFYLAKATTRAWARISDSF